MRIPMIAAAFAMIALPSLALADADAAAPVAAPAAKPEKPKKVCRVSPASSTSRIGAGRTCMTEADWVAFDAKGGDKANSGRSVQTASPQN